MGGTRARKESIMNFESNRRVSARRANDDFWRRMLGAESADGSRAVMNSVPSPSPMPMPSLPQERPDRPSCDGSYPNRPSGDGGRSDRPSCDGSYPNRGEGNGDCQMTPGMPSLAMVYAPRQCWQNLLDPATGLANGSIFADLILPFEGSGGCGCGGGDSRYHGRGGCGV